MTDQTTKQAFESWAIVELFGHQRTAGKVTEETIAGGAFIRLDVPEVEGKPGFSRLLNPSAIYAINPCTEETARGFLAKFCTVRPLDEFDARRMLEPATATGDHFEPEDDELPY